MRLWRGRCGRIRRRLPQFISVTLPLAIVITCVIIMVRLSAENEIIATPPAIAAGVEEASKDAVARCFVSIKS